MLCIISHICGSVYRTSRSGVHLPLPHPRSSWHNPLLTAAFMPRRWPTPSTPLRP